MPFDAVRQIHGTAAAFSDAATCLVAHAGQALAHTRVAASTAVPPARAGVDAERLAHARHAPAATVARAIRTHRAGDRAQHGGRSVIDGAIAVIVETVAEVDRARSHARARVVAIAAAADYRRLPVHVAVERSVVRADTRRWITAIAHRARIAVLARGIAGARDRSDTCVSRLVAARAQGAYPRAPPASPTRATLFGTCEAVIAVDIGGARADACIVDGWRVATTASHRDEQ